MKTNLQRIKNDMEIINNFNSTPKKGITRLSYSKEDKKARNYLIEEMNKLNLDLKFDGVGNIRAKYAGTDPDLPIVMTGSHIDTVVNGGRFDGLLGVVSGLEVLRTLSENNIKTKHSIELVIFSEEEGTNFGSTMVGSKYMVGKYNLKDLKKLKNDQGNSLYEVAKKCGFTPDQDKSKISSKDLKAMLELHIEQGEVLESENKNIGIVKAIAGMKSLSIEVGGVSNHAGSTPMNLRKDPMVGAAELILKIKELAEKEALPTTVGTVGKIYSYPNVSNVIPNKVEFSLDVRDVKKKGIELLLKKLYKEIDKVKNRLNLETNITIIGESDPIKLSEEIINIIEKAAVDRKISYKKMNSGAVHDSCMLSSITDVGMIFIPSIKGRSHCPEELSRYEDIKLGSDILLDTILKLAE